jgi:hypothetical protein
MSIEYSSVCNPHPDNMQDWGVEAVPWCIAGYWTAWVVLTCLMLYQIFPPPRLTTWMTPETSTCPLGVQDKNHGPTQMREVFTYVFKATALLPLWQPWNLVHVQISFTCQLGKVMGCTDTWLNIISVRYFWKTLALELLNWAKDGPVHYK